MRKILFATAVSLLSLVGLAGTPVRHLEQIKATSAVEVDHEAGELHLTLDLTLDDLRVRGNDLIILTPTLSRADGSYTLPLQPLYIVGGTREKALNRQLHFGHKPDYYVAVKPQSITRRRNGRAQTIHYTVTVPFDKRMRGAVLSLEEWLTGCAECDKGSGSLVLRDPVVKAEPYRPTYVSTCIVPAAEPVKSRSDKYSATIAFRLDKDNIDRGYRDNAAVLDDVDAKVRSVLANKDITLTGMTVEGWASPEGNASYNQALSERRAKAFANYLSRTHGLKQSEMSVRGCGEDWAGVERLLASSDPSYKAELETILKENQGDARDPKIKALNGGAVYYDLVNGLYTKVRRTDYAFAYTVRSFNLAEARERIKTNPKLLSLNEMYIVANSYEVGSKEYDECFQIAVKWFPNDPIALVNAAAADLAKGDVSAAMARLDKANDTRAQALNNRGIALALNGKYAEAETCFKEAIAKGDTSATGNLAELKKVVESL